MKKIFIFGLLICTAFVFPIIASSQSSESGSVQGSVFQDTNGDGVCQDGSPLPGILVVFELPSINSKVSTRSAADGSFNVGAAAQGTWTVSAQSSTGRWVAVSANPIQVNISEDAGLNKEQVNFCMQLASVAESKAAAQATSSPSTSVASTEPAETEVVVAPAEPSKPLPEQAKELLTTPPESVQPTSEQ